MVSAEILLWPCGGGVGAIRMDSADGSGLKRGDEHDKELWRAAMDNAAGRTEVFALLCSTVPAICVS